jgi:hypothetical protein
MPSGKLQTPIEFSIPRIATGYICNDLIRRTEHRCCYFLSLRLLWTYHFRCSVIKQS